jgi:hypothetical protein
MVMRMKKPYNPYFLASIGFIPLMVTRARFQLSNYLREPITKMINCLWEEEVHTSLRILTKD